ncbi:Pyridine nucleotide-disulfide oxidoreductase family protein [Babesia bovis T2Bo]|uniref:Pyridine nucleotide-disulphide oxidoreductase domain containing protein n=1 Tax=Babesia bovis TaxID=5865 RepID=A7AMF1_BABBO|nr:Pyridine nucleotide-disulfide oxidoreductase family protein [Babesia bovis T2Bo]EDO07735.1 Pyridine nucleotide-disulfide oxidoreductase family protein [Babesia bovis T2Bo]|eukprot:XP_001611303.1 pyridine nucleotide-disulphide oxidoreductase domain containing protein [Babesia bovis T2Bo]
MRDMLRFFVRSLGRSATYARQYGSKLRNVVNYTTYKAQKTTPISSVHLVAATSGITSLFFAQDKNTPQDLERVKIGNVSDFKDGEMREVLVNEGCDLLLVTKIKGQIYCTGAKCPHHMASLVDGGCTEEYLICPKHNAKFDISSGECVNGPCFSSIPSYKVEVEGDEVYAYLPPSPIDDVVEPKCKVKPGKDERVFVICGGGAAAHAAAETLRLEGFGGRIIIYGDEPHLPYYRPHLTKRIESKGYAEVAEEQALRSPLWYRANQVEYHGGKRVTAVSHEDNTITLEDGTSVKYDKVLVATGSVAFVLPMSRDLGPLKNHFTIRTVDDMERIVKYIKPNMKVVIVGANFVGCEMASSLKDKQVNVTLITDMAVPMSNIIGERGGSAIMKLLQKNGVKVLTSEMVKNYNVKDGRITHVVTAKASVDADLVIEGVGARVNMDLLKCAQKNRDGTVNVDGGMRCVGCPDNVFAAGDIVTYPYHMDGQNISIKHWNVALQHGRVAAKSMLGKKATMNMIPFFWSEFFYKGFRFAGVANGVEDIVYEGDVENCKFIAYYVKASKVIAMLAMGMDHIGAQLAEAMEKGCAPSYSALKLGAANSDTMMQCLKKRLVK